MRDILCEANVCPVFINFNQVIVISNPRGRHECHVLLLTSVGLLVANHTYGGEGKLCCRCL